MFLNFYPKNINYLHKSRADYDKTNYKYRVEIVWFNVFVLSILHGIALFGMYLWLVAWRCQLQTFLFQFIWALSASFGITGGAHRLWCHRSYKANLPLRILYGILMSMIFANDIYTWVRDHRSHHKFSETDADPHNAKRGFFFSHCGWLLVKRHPEVLRAGATISYKDLEGDGVVMFHRKYYGIIMPLGTFLLPTFVPWYFWNQEYSFFLCVLRYIINIHIVWSLNSFAHLYGTKPYEKGIYAAENTTMMYISIGEGFHNYHHVFPWDYKAAEFGNDRRNLTTFLIEAFASIGWANELKMASNDVIQRRALRTGDGSRDCTNLLGRRDLAQEMMLENNVTEPVDQFWGWDDPDVSQDTKESVVIVH